MASDINRPESGVVGTNPEIAFRSGLTVLAAVLMIVGGAMAIFEGIAAIAKGGLFLPTRHYVFEFNLTGWGWIHLILGIVLVLAGCAVFSGAVWARFFGVAIAGLGAIANFLWVPYYPVWATVLIALNLLIAWALCAGMHDEVERDHGARYRGRH
ncbi:hypothetical protein ACF08M_06905 [Streptomyces sp. NPDC015032]|uniref:DUF7144 family membrane protein n=1 Tax=Streptomyces sp. NPDC015032 TaxID=3364937 RepID=UPI0036F6D38C